MRPGRPAAVACWMYNRIPEAQRDGILDSTLARPESPLRKLVVRFAGQKRYFVSEAFVYRLLRVHDTITGAAFNVVAVVEEFHAKTTKVLPVHLPRRFLRYVGAWKFRAGIAGNDVAKLWRRR
jgi:hypothetical protein